MLLDAWRAAVRLNSFLRRVKSHVPSGAMHTHLQGVGLRKKFAKDWHACVITIASDQAPKSRLRPEQR